MHILQVNTSLYKHEHILLTAVKAAVRSTMTTFIHFVSMSLAIFLLNLSDILAMLLKKRSNKV